MREGWLEGSGFTVAPAVHWRRATLLHATRLHHPVLLPEGALLTSAAVRLAMPDAPGWSVGDPLRASFRRERWSADQPRRSRNAARRARLMRHARVPRWPRGRRRVPRGRGRPHAP